MNIIKAEQIHIKQAVRLAKREYEAERISSPQLINKDFEDSLTSLITELFQKPYSYVAAVGEEIIGYIAFWDIREGFFGNCKGVFSPLGGSAFSGEDRNKSASKLLSYALKAMISDGVTSVAICRYAHDEEVGRGFVLNGFGIRCSDAVMNLNLMQNSDKFAFAKEEADINEQDQITFGELDQSEYPKITELEKGLCRHLSSSPIFFPTPMKFFDTLSEHWKNRFFAAKKDDEVIGFIEVTQDEGETFVSEDPSMYNICGTYVDPDYRDGKIARQLLSCVVHTLFEEGISYLGVDCETLNPTALRFWGKYFEAYTYSYHRRIDERVVGYEAYVNHYWEQKDKERK